MKTQVNLTNCVGKMLSAVEFGGNQQLVLSFSDGTFCTLGITYGYEGGDEDIAEVELDDRDFGDAALVRSGVMTAEEIGELRKEERAAQAASQDAVDRLRYQELRAKFEGGEQG